MNKEKAKEKFCPIIKDLCLADHCMMWKFNTLYEPQLYYTSAPLPPPKPIGFSETDGDCALKKS